MTVATAIVKLRVAYQVLIPSESDAVLGVVAKLFTLAQRSHNAPALMGDAWSCTCFVVADCFMIPQLELVSRRRTNRTVRREAGTTVDIGLQLGFRLGH